MASKQISQCATKGCLESSITKYWCKCQRIIPINGYCFNCSKIICSKCGFQKKNAISKQQLIWKNSSNITNTSSSQETHLPLSAFKNKLEQSQSFYPINKCSKCPSTSKFMLLQYKNCKHMICSKCMHQQIINKLSESQNNWNINVLNKCCQCKNGEYQHLQNDINTKCIACFQIFPANKPCKKLKFGRIQNKCIQSFFQNQMKIKPLLAKLFFKCQYVLCKTIFEQTTSNNSKFCSSQCQKKQKYFIQNKKSSSINTPSSKPFQSSDKFNKDNPRKQQQLLGQHSSIKQVVICSLCKRKRTQNSMFGSDFSILQKQYFCFSCLEDQKRMFQKYQNNGNNQIFKKNQNKQEVISFKKKQIYKKIYFNEQIIGLKKAINRSQNILMSIINPMPKDQQIYIASFKGTFTNCKQCNYFVQDRNLLQQKCLNCIVQKQLSS